MGGKTKLWYLENFNLLSGLSKKEMMAVGEKTVMTTVNKDQYIYFPEDPSRVLFFLKEGRVKVANTSDEGRENIMTILRPGEIFGELGLVGEDKRKDYAQAMDDNTLICAMSIADMEEMMTQSAAMTLKVTRWLGFRLRKMERKLNALIFKDARTRIVDLIREMAEEFGQPAGEETLVKHFLTHQDMANLTATSRQTVTTVLNELRDKNVINFERKRILVRDLSKLV